jgi:hypothetical protein
MYGYYLKRKKKKKNQNQNPQKLEKGDLVCFLVSVYDERKQ